VFISVRQGDVEVGSLYLAVYHSVFLLTRLLKNLWADFKMKCGAIVIIIATVIKVYVVPFTN